jgi:hypothetical protein
MTAKLGPSMIALGEPADDPVAANSRAGPAPTVARTADETPLEYPFPGGTVPIIRTSDKTAGAASPGHPVPAADAKPVEAAQPSAGETFVRISPSIIAMAEPEPAVSFEEVAAVGKDTADAGASGRETFGPGPTVIRGGVVDNGDATPISVPAAQAKRPAIVQRPAAMANAQSAASPQAAASSQPAPKKPEVPIPSPTPAPPPAGIIPQAKIQ